MSAYVISEVGVLDEAGAARYRQLAAASISLYGGRYLVRGAEPDVPRGKWPTGHRVVVVEFVDLAQAREWFDSAEYAEARALAETVLDRRLLFVEGVGPH
jgi:uncharacterized protein (DUF1330 family)